MKNSVYIFTVIFAAGLGLSFAHAHGKPGEQRDTKEHALARGYCGDGMINGHEDCDGTDIKIRSCQVLNGGEGEIKCQPNCVYDISSCGRSEQSIADTINERLGGIAEVCKCSCASDNCDGGCAPISTIYGPNVDCLFRCDNSCTCNCEDKMEAHIEYCNLGCQCTNDTQGNPQCMCKLEECEMLAVIKPNIGNIPPRLRD